MFTAGGSTHPGRVRPINEDAFVFDHEAGFFAVADGMGGHNAGEVASSVAIETIRTFLTRTRESENVTWPYGIDPALSFDGNRLVTAIKLANRRVFKAGESRDDYTGMGTTIEAALVAGDRLMFVSVGDSRLYTLVDNELVQLTEDDTWVRMTDAVDPRTIAKHPMRHVLTNVIGARDQIECRVTERPLGARDTFLLSTDGLHGAADAATIAAVLRGTDPPDVVADRLVHAALERGGSDNITAVVIHHRPEPGRGSTPLASGS
jgi:serine/threonine protein phosphatase PrpC